VSIMASSVISCVVYFSSIFS